MYPNKSLLLEGINFLATPVPWPVTNEPFEILSGSCFTKGFAGVAASVDCTKPAMFQLKSKPYSFDIDTQFIPSKEIISPFVAIAGPASFPAG